MTLSAVSVLLVSSMSQSIDLALEEKQGILDALTAFAQPHHTCFKGLKLTPDQIVRIERLPDRGLYKDQVRFRLRLVPGGPATGGFTAQKLSKRWALVHFWGPTDYPRDRSAWKINTDAEVVAMAKWYFGDTIKALGLKVFDVKWTPPPAPFAGPPRVAGVNVYQSRAKTRVNDPCLSVAWHRSDLALIYFSIRPADDPDLRQESDPPADDPVSRLLR